MYWPTAAAREIDCPKLGEGSDIQAIRSSKKGNFFVSFTRDTLAVWDVRVSCFLLVLTGADDIAHGGASCGCQVRKELGEVG